MENVMFWATGVGLVVMSLLVVWARSPLRSALALICTLCLQAVLYIMLDAPFVAAMQVLVYAGAIMVLFLFVIMLLNLGPDAVRRPSHVALFGKAVGVAGVTYFATRLLQAGRFIPTQATRVDGSVKHIGVLLLTDYLFAFEAISILLLVAVVGAIVFGMKRLT